MLILDEFWYYDNYVVQLWILRASFGATGTFKCVNCFWPMEHQMIVQARLVGSSVTSVTQKNIPRAVVYYNCAYTNVWSIKNLTITVPNYAQWWSDFLWIRHYCALYIFLCNRRYMVGIFCPLGWNRVKVAAKICCGHVPMSTCPQVHLTPARTPSLSRLKSQVLKLSLFNWKMMMKNGHMVYNQA
jgi:hypothetical protein